MTTSTIHMKPVGLLWTEAIYQFINWVGWMLANYGLSWSGVLAIMSNQNKTAMKIK
jgi:hypothetical protein